MQRDQPRALITRFRFLEVVFDDSFPDSDSDSDGSSNSNSVRSNRPNSYLAEPAVTRADRR